MFQIYYTKLENILGVGKLMFALQRFLSKNRDLTFDNFSPRVPRVLSSDFLISNIFLHFNQWMKTAFQHLNIVIAEFNNLFLVSRKTETISICATDNHFLKRETLKHCPLQPDSFIKIRGY